MTRVEEVPNGGEAKVIAWSLGLSLMIALVAWVSTLAA